MYAGLKIVVAIPCYRAAATVSEVIATLPALVDVVIAVDDASPDQTRQVLQANKDPRLIVLTHERNQGVGGAMRTAFRKAMEIGCDVVVKMDSDGQMHPSDLVPLLDALIKGDYDYAKGNRFLHRRELERMPKLRLLGNLGLTFLTKLASGYWHIFDPQNGFVACRSRALGDIDLDNLASDYFFENDMLIRLNVIGARVVDVPMPARYGEERSSMKLSRILLKFPWRLFCGYWRRILQRFVLRDFSPLVLFLCLGILMMTFGTAFGGYSWIQSWRTGVVASAGTIMVAALPTILGFQLLLQAMVLDIQSTPR
jgi:glycosyltransferase involved in cell wall biosynthesis